MKREWKDKPEMKEKISAKHVGSGRFAINITEQWLESTVYKEVRFKISQRQTQ